MNRFPLVFRNQDDGTGSTFGEVDDDFFDPNDPTKTSKPKEDNPPAGGDDGGSDGNDDGDKSKEKQKAPTQPEDVTELIDLTDFDDAAKESIIENLRNAQNYLKLSDEEKKRFDDSLDEEQKKVLAESLSTIEKLKKPDDNKPDDDSGNTVDYKSFVKSSIAAIDKRYGTTTSIKEEEITEENYLDIVAENVIKHIDKKAIVSPQAAMLDELLENGASFDEAVEAVRKGSYVQAMKDEEIAKIAGEQAYGLKGEDLDEFIKAAKPWEIKKYRAEIEASYQSQFEAQIAKQREESFNARKGEYEKNLTETFENFKKRSDIYGVPIDAKQKEEFQNVLKEYTQEDPKTGKAKITEFLEDNDKLAELIFLVHYGPSSIPGTLTKEKNRVKESIKKKLEVSPTLTSNNTRIPKAGVNYAVFDQPDDGS